MVDPSFLRMTFLVGVSPELIGSVSFGGLRAYGLGYAVDPDTEATIYLSLVGYRTAVRGVWEIGRASCRERV